MEKWNFQPSSSPGQVKCRNFALRIYKAYNIAVISYIVIMDVSCLYADFAEARKMSNFFFPKK